MYTMAREDRDDLVQDMIYQLWKSYGSFAGRSSQSTWLYRVAMNVAIHRLKRNQRQPATTSLNTEQMSALQQNDNKADDKMALLRRHFSKLDLLERGIILLYLEDKSYAEIANIVGLSETNVGSRLTRIRRKLEKEINKNDSA